MQKFAVVPTCLFLKTERVGSSEQNTMNLLTNPRLINNLIIISEYLTVDIYIIEAVWTALM